MLAGGQFAAFGLIAPNWFCLTELACCMPFRRSSGSHSRRIVCVVLPCCAARRRTLLCRQAVQRMAIPEASPTLPLAASLASRLATT